MPALIRVKKNIKPALQLEEAGFSVLSLQVSGFFVILRKVQLAAVIHVDHNRIRKGH